MYLRLHALNIDMMDSNPEKANFAPLPPISFLLQGAEFFSSRTAVIYGDTQYTYGEFFARVSKLATAIKSKGITVGDCVAILATNIPAMLETHYAVPLLGAILNPLNTKLDAASIGYALSHAEARLLICDREYLNLARQAVEQAGNDLPITIINDPAAGLPFEPGQIDYAEFLTDAPSSALNLELENEFQPISFLYTSGTTATPKAVVYIHRGAYLAALSNVLSFGLSHNTVYLWTWPMFHSNGLSFIWAVTAVGGTHVCLRSIETAKVFELIKVHRISHFAVAPAVINLLAGDPNATSLSLNHPVNCAVGGAAPPSTIISKMDDIGIEVTHQYGSTECYGPATVAWRRHHWDAMTTEERYQMMARQGTPTPAIANLMVADPETLKPVPRDGQSLGEVMLRGNTVMQGYLDDVEASNAAMTGGWFRPGDVAVWHPDGAIEIEDRSVDLIISDGERISSVEIEEVLYQHPKIHEAAVVAKPDRTLGEIPCAFITAVVSNEPDADELKSYCQSRLAEFKIPKQFIFGDLPKTATGKIRKNVLRDRLRQMNR